jgi:hypothetical protein
MAAIITKNVDPLTVPSPAVGKTAFGTTTSNEVFIKDETGTITVLAGGATTLDGLTDVSISGPVANEVLGYDGAEWINVPSAGLPTGGTTGQVLTKVDSVDYNVEWTTPSAGGGEQFSPFLLMGA